MKMLPRLQAEERLGAIDVALLAAGGFEKHDATQLIQGLRTQATGNDQRRPAKADHAQLAAMGIGVKVARPAGAPING